MTFRFVTALAWLIGPLSTLLSLGLFFLCEDHADPWAAATVTFGFAALIADAWLIARYLL